MTNITFNRGTLSTGITFVIDKRGDTDNLKYGGNHVYSVPEYKRSGGGKVIGLPNNKRIDNSSSRSGQVTLTDRFNRVTSKIYTSK